MACRRLTMSVTSSDHARYTRCKFYAHGMCHTALQAVFGQSPSPSLLAWIGFTKATDQQWVDGFLRRIIRSSYCSPFAEQCATVDEQLLGTLASMSAAWTSQQQTWVAASTASAQCGAMSIGPLDCSKLTAMNWRIRATLSVKNRVKPDASVWRWLRLWTGRDGSTSRTMRLELYRSVVWWRPTSNKLSPNSTYTICCGFAVQQAGRGCCGFVVDFSCMLSICCGFVADLLWVCCIWP